MVWLPYYFTAQVAIFIYPIFAWSWRYVSKIIHCIKSNLHGRNGCNNLKKRIIINEEVGANALLKLKDSSTSEVAKIGRETNIMAASSKMQTGIAIIKLKLLYA